jgi:hypothetical protein
LDVAAFAARITAVAAGAYLQCERCDMRSPLRVENADVVKPAGWHLEDVHLCWHCVEHTTVDGVPRADRLTSAATPTPQPRATRAQRWGGAAVASIDARG